MGSYGQEIDFNMKIEHENSMSSKKGDQFLCVEFEMISNWKCQVGELEALFWKLSNGQDFFVSTNVKRIENTL